MNFLKKSLVGAAVAVACAASFATPITVGGVTWDPDYVDGPDQDFGATFSFNQWFSTTSSAGGSIANGSYTSALTIGTIQTDLSNGGGFGTYWLQGVGEVTGINGRPGTGGPFVAAGNELTYAFGGIKANADGTLDASQGWAKLFVNSTTPDYNSPASGESEVADAQSGNLWLDLSILGVTVVGGSITGGAFVEAVLLATGGEAFGNFMPSIVSYTASAQFNSLAATVSSLGNGQISGNTVPEPASLALVGLGLLGLAAARRRKSV